MSSRSEHGLTMIEVLAAMVIFSAGAVILFSWIGQAADRLAKLGVEQKQLFAELAALEFAKSLNPMKDPAGTITVAGTEIRWSSASMGAEQQARNSSGAEGAYAVQLYQVQLEALVPNGPKAERSLLVAGWRQTRAVRQTPFGPSSGLGNATPAFAPPATVGAPVGR